MAIDLSQWWENQTCLLSSVNFSTFYRQLLATNCQFLKLGSYCPKVRSSLPHLKLGSLLQKYDYYVSVSENGNKYWRKNCRFLELGSFCPQIRSFLPRVVFLTLSRNTTALKLGSMWKCWKNNTAANRLCLICNSREVLVTPNIFLAGYLSQWSRHGVQNNRWSIYQYISGSLDSMMWWEAVLQKSAFSRPRPNIMIYPSGGGVQCQKIFSTLRP